MTPKELLGQQQPTLKTIASIAGLGISTVSRALKDGPEIGENTKRRVREIAAQLGYHPNRAGVRLRTGKTNVISLVIDTAESVMGVVSGLVYGISDVLAGTPYHLVVMPYSLDDPMEPIRYIAETRSADGIIFSRVEPHDPRVAYLAERGIPFATHGRTAMGIVHPYHDFDNEAYAREAVRRLAERGRKNLCFFGPDPGYAYHWHLRAGFDSEIARRGLNEVSREGPNADAALADITALGREMASWPNRPDGIVSSAFVPAVALIAGIESAGLKLGRDIDIVTKWYSQVAKLCRRELIGIDEDFREAGRDLARGVIAWIDGADPAGHQTLIGPRI
jgi:LacI family transcriptional regulator